MRKNIRRNQLALRGSRSPRSAGAEPAPGSRLSERQLRLHVEPHRRDIEIILARGAVATVVAEAPADLSGQEMLRQLGWDGTSTVFALEDPPPTMPSRSVALFTAKSFVVFQLPDLN